MTVKSVLLFAVLFAAPAFGQNYSITGKVNDPQGKPVDLFNVVALHPGDSAMVKGAVFQEGAFELKDVSETPVLLRITSTGFAAFYKTVDNSAHQGTVDLGTVALKSLSIKEVEVTAKVPLVQKEGDRTRVNVEGTMLNGAGTAIDVLESSPGVLVSGEGNVSVFGKGSAVVYLDGQPITQEMLHALPSDQIRYIEIIEHPPASYDAQGRVVINIVSKKNALEGYQVDLMNLVTVAPLSENMTDYFGSSLLYKHKQFSLMARYGLFSGDRWGSKEYLRSFDNNGSAVTMRNLIEDNNHFKGNHSYGLGGKYEIDSTRNVSLFYSGAFNAIDKTSADTNLVTIQNVPYTLNALTKSRAQNFSNNLNLAYNHICDTLGGKRSANLSYSDYTNEMTGDISESLVDSSGATQTPKRSHGTNGIRIFSAQVDVAHAYGKKYLWENGVKLSSIGNRSSVGLERMFGSSWQEDTTIKNGFKYGEQTAALYSQFQFRYTKWNARVGLRGELTHPTGYSQQLDSTVVDTTYFTLFPSFFGEYKLMKDLSLNASYAFRINRPAFSDLDPFVTYIDSLSYMKGNPGLRPELIHEASLALVYLEAASIELGYTYTGRSMNTYVERSGSNSNQFVAQERNFDFAKSYDLSVDLPYENSWYTTSNGFGYNLGDAHYTNAGTTIINRRDMWYFYSYQAFRFLKHWTVEGTYSYNTGGADGLFVGEPFSTLRVSVQYKSKEGRFSVRLVGNDLLRSTVEIGHSRIPGFDLTYTERNDTYWGRLNISCRLGKLKKRDFNEAQINSEERGRIK